MALSREETSSLYMTVRKLSPIKGGKGHLEFVHEDCNRKEFIVRLHCVGTRISIELKIVRVPSDDDGRARKLSLSPNFLTQFRSTESWADSAKTRPLSFERARLDLQRPYGI